MSGQSANLITAKGLVTFSSELTVPEGSLVKATNVNIDERGVITRRRGYNLYGDSFGSSSDTLSQIMQYKDRLIRHYSNILQFDDGSGTFTSFSGTYSEIEDGFRLKYQEANSNFYFTSSDGIKKISETSASNVSSSSITSAGAIKAYDISASIVADATGFMPTESKVAYRVVFGTRDNTNNLLLGSPSARYVLTNSSAVDRANSSVEITLPSDITTNYFYQVYRTAPVEPSGSLTLSDIDPGDEMNLVIENPITSADIVAGTITVSDITPDDFRENGAFLYTNEITGEGILQSNEPPPIAKDITLFRNSMFYGNTKTLHQLNVNLLSITAFTAGTSELIISNSTTSRRYVFDNTEDVPNQQVELSGSASVAQAIDETSRSLVRVINRDPSGIVYARYLSSPSDLPGSILLESRSLTDDNFYLSTNDTAIKTSFNPQLPEIETIVDVTFSAGSGSPANIQATGHGLSTGTQLFINSPDTTPAISGTYEITVIDADNFTIPVNITGEDLVGTNAFYFIPSADVTSDNLEASNRIYFSKINQPEAVPSVNYIEIGPKDEAIERIVALRDNLFVFKTDGVYIVDGVTAPNFSVRLLDNSTNIIAPDSAVVLNNQIYCLTTQGISTVSETGVSIISRVIEDRILGITNSKFNYRLSSFGVAYESDRAYLLWLPTETSDTVSTQCYRYNIFERAWTRWDKPATCGLVLDSNDKMYLGDTSSNYMLQERKNFDRTDFADENTTKNIGSSKVNGNIIELNNITDVEIGDVLVQTQYITVDIYNRLLRKLDIDAGFDDTDYESTLLMSAGDNITSKMNSLNAKLVSDDSSGIITAKVFSTTWSTLRDQFNTLIDELNDNLCDTIFKNYRKEESNTYVFEAVITEVDKTYNLVTVSYSYNFIEGDLEVYKNINATIQWSPQHFGNPSVLKQMREGTIIYDQNNFYSAKVSYSSDISAGFVDIPFQGKGVGFWGSSMWGSQSPDFYWGGNGNDVPFRTIIPRQKQRGRYLNIKYNHFNARETFRILGISVVVRPLSTRAYR